MLHRLIFGLREVRSAQQEQAEAPELLRHSVLLFLNAISVVVHSALTCKITTYPKFCIGFIIRKSRSEQLLLSGLGHSK